MHLMIDIEPENDWSRFYLDRLQSGVSVYRGAVGCRRWHLQAAVQKTKSRSGSRDSCRPGEPQSRCIKARRPRRGRDVTIDDCKQQRQQAAEFLLSHHSHKISGHTENKPKFTAKPAYRSSNKWGSIWSVCKNSGFSCNSGKVAGQNRKRKQLSKLHSMGQQLSQQHEQPSQNCK